MVVKSCCIDALNSSAILVISCLVFDVVLVLPQTAPSRRQCCLPFQKRPTAALTASGWRRWVVIFLHNRILCSTLNLLSFVSFRDPFTFLSGTLNTKEARNMADKCQTCGLGTIMTGGSNPIILHEIRFLLNDLLTASQTCFVCGMLYKGVSLLPDFEDVQEIEVNKSEVAIRQIGQNASITYEFYIPSSISCPDFVR
jgi:hypothetical protein